MDMSSSLQAFWEDLSNLEEQIKGARNKTFVASCAPSSLSATYVLDKEDVRTDGQCIIQRIEPDDVELGCLKVVPISLAAPMRTAKNGRKRSSRRHQTTSSSTYAPRTDKFTNSSYKPQAVLSLTEDSIRNTKILESKTSIAPTSAQNEADIYKIQSIPPHHQSQSKSKPQNMMKPANTGGSILPIFYKASTPELCLSYGPCSDSSVLSNAIDNCPTVTDNMLPPVDIELAERLTVLGIAEPSTSAQSLSCKTANTNLRGKHSISNHRQNPYSRHFRWCGHGKLWTSVAILFATAGCILSLGSRQSKTFIQLLDPLYIAPIYQPVLSMGLIEMELCFNESVTEQSVSQTLSIEGQNKSSTDDYLALRGCQTIRLSPEEVDDFMFNLSRSLLSLGAALGIALTVILPTSIVWETINLRPVAFSYIIAYFFQSFTMLVFDSEVCSKYNCRMGPGGIMCILASLCWVVVSIAVVKMDSFKVRSIRERRQAARKLAKLERNDEKQTQEPEDQMHLPVVHVGVTDEESVATARASDVENESIEGEECVVVSSCFERNTVALEQYSI